MVKVLSGLVKCDAGTVLLDGTPLSLTSPEVSRSCGIAAAYQDLSLIPRLSIRENLMLGREPGGAGNIIPRQDVSGKAAEFLEHLGVKVSPGTLVMDLDLSTQSLVEFVKALVWNPRYLLLDEITASLFKEQVERLFALLRQLASGGMSILFVSHRLDEVFSLCSFTTILRGGKTVAEEPLEGSNESDLVFHMTGKRIETAQRAAEAREKSADELPLLEVKGLGARPWFSDISLRAYKGEVVGIAGLQGQGQAEFLRALYGHIRTQEGEVFVNGERVSFRVPADAVKHGFGFIPGDREREGIFQVRPVYENIFSAYISLKSIFMLLDPRKLLEEAKRIFEKLSIVAGSPRAFRRTPFQGGINRNWLSAAGSIYRLRS